MHSARAPFAPSPPTALYATSLRAQISSLPALRAIRPQAAKLGGILLAADVVSGLILGRSVLNLAKKDVRGA